MVSSRSAVSLLHTDLQVENFQRCQHVFHQCQAWVTCSFPSVSCCWLSFSSTISHLLSLFQSSLPVHLMPALVYTSCCTAIIFKVLYCKVKNVLFLCVCLFMYYLCENYYKPITVQYYIPDCVSWVPRLTLSDLLTNWMYDHALWTILVHTQRIYCISEEALSYHPGSHHWVLGPVLFQDSEWEHGIIDTKGG